MGSAASGPTRAYTVENGGNVVDISDNVVKRLKNQLGELGKRNVCITRCCQTRCLVLNFVLNLLLCNRRPCHLIPMLTGTPVFPYRSAEPLHVALIESWSSPRECGRRWSGNPNNIHERTRDVTQLAGRGPGARGCLNEERHVLAEAN